ncbi:hypothetical protein CURTO8I2_130053 [Curtobacterium sp. 8I-2]|nr:hypothetical protein CURTO8I2_130053 [Curtobacterium sp. 8I-2]
MGGVPRALAGAHHGPAPVDRRSVPVVPLHRARRTGPLIEATGRIL